MGRARNCGDTSASCQAQHSDADLKQLLVKQQGTGRLCRKSGTSLAQRKGVGLIQRTRVQAPKLVLGRRPTRVSGSLTQATKRHKWGCAVYPGQALHKRRVQSRSKRHECRLSGTEPSSKLVAAVARVRLCRISGTSREQDSRPRSAFSGA